MADNGDYTVPIMAANTDCSPCTGFVMQLEHFSLFKPHTQFMRSMLSAIFTLKLRKRRKGDYITCVAANWLSQALNTSVLVIY